MYNCHVVVLVFLVVVAVGIGEVLSQVGAGGNDVRRLGDGVSSFMPFFDYYKAVIRHSFRTTRNSMGHLYRQI